MPGSRAATRKRFSKSSTRIWGIAAQPSGARIEPQMPRTTNAARATDARVRRDRIPRVARVNLRPDSREDTVAEAAALPERDAPATPPKTFNVGDIFRDRATFGKFAAITGFIMGQVFPAAFFGLMLTAIYREKGLPLDMFWVFMLP